MICWRGWPEPCVPLVVTLMWWWQSKCHHQALYIAEFRQIGERPCLINSASIGLPRSINIENIGRSHDMLAESLHILKEKAAITATDAVVIISAALIPFRILNLPYMYPKELSRESREPDYWSDLEPDLSKYHNHLIRYQFLHSSENDDMTCVLLSFAEDHVVQLWIDITLAGHFNPVCLENELLSLANMRVATLPAPEQLNAQLILHQRSMRTSLGGFAFILISVPFIHIVGFFTMTGLEI